MISITDILVLSLDKNVSLLKTPKSRTISSTNIAKEGSNMVGTLQFLTVNKRQVLKLACVATFFSILFFSVLSPNYLSFVRAPISQPTQDSITPRRGFDIKSW
ncbi:hypothetical protein RRG08_041693 [Elysia crispata]|uniref:Uncharacterized protein n=1 Tax=Elysia crispata TaxID=231223 RepID=A0AAE1AXG4_9GAST|nr:hypothetical protein RRG08_041693 [Elysia crispata]